MTAFEWKPVYTVGDDHLDDQHKTLIRLMNDFYDSDLSGHMDAARTHLANLLALTVQHFKEEEEMMERTGYPRFKEHRQYHHDLLKQVEKLVRDYLHFHSQETAGKLASFLKVWLTRHILGADKKYGPYVHKAPAVQAGPAAASQPATGSQPGVTHAG